MVSISINVVKIGNISLQFNVLLAPMAGVTDLPFRQIVRKFGQFLMYSEMVASQAVIRNVTRTRTIMNSANDPYTAVQLVGADPKVIADAARLSYDLGAKILDINMGCPVKKIVKTDAGSALMKDENLAQKIIHAVVNATPLPVTLKIRLGWDDNHLNAPTIAHIAEDEGIKMVTVHARTRCQLYSGVANWKAVQAVRDVIKIPLIINGDITDAEKAKQALADSNADGVMIGRGALGQPWILRDIDNVLNNKTTEQLSNNEKLNIAKEHISSVLAFYSKRVAFTLAKKVVMYYCKGRPNATKFRAIMSDSSVKTETELFNILENVFS